MSKLHSPTTVEQVLEHLHKRYGARAFTVENAFALISSLYPSSIFGVCKSKRSRVALINLWLTVIQGVHYGSYKLEQSAPKSYTVIQFVGLEA